MISVFPGRVRSSIAQNSKGWKDEKDKLLNLEFQKKQATLTSESAAEQIINGIYRNKRSIYVGHDAKLIYLILRFFPNTGEDLINKIIKNSERSFKMKFSLLDEHRRIKTNLIEKVLS